MFSLLSQNNYFTFLLGSNFHALIVESRPAEYSTLFTSSNVIALTPKQCPALSCAGCGMEYDTRFFLTRISAELPGRRGRAITIAAYIYLYCSQLVQCGHVVLLLIRDYYFTLRAIRT